MKSRYLKTTIALGILVVFFSCETDVTNTLTVTDSETKLVLEGGIERNTLLSNPTQRVRLTTTANFLDASEQPIVENANVSISDGEGDWPLTYQGNGYYGTDALEPVLGRTYTITIQWEGETYQGSDMLNQVPEILDFYSVFEEETLFTDAGYFVRLDTQDPPNVPNYYYYRVFRNGEFVIVPDPGNSSVLVVSDEFFDGQLRVGVNPNDEAIFVLGDIARAQQIGISEAYHDYLFLIFDQTGNAGLSFVGNPPPASIRGNLVNVTNPTRRALGFFYAADVEERTLTVTE